MTPGIFIGVIIGILATRAWMAVQARWRAPRRYVCPNGDLYISSNSRNVIRMMRRYHEPRCRARR